jgi:hypothetical protein
MKINSFIGWMWKTVVMIPCLYISWEDNFFSVGMDFLLWNMGIVIVGGDNE